MPLITAIKRNVKNTQRCSVFVDGEFFVACSIDVAVALELRKGLEMSSELERELRTHDRRIVLKQKIWHYAMYKPRTERQVKSKLSQLECSEEELVGLLGWLKEFGQLDDVAYAERFVEASKERKQLSRSDLIRRLQVKGIDKDLAECVVERCLTSEAALEGAYLVAEKKLRTIDDADEKSQRERLSRFMAGRGYDWSIIKTTLKKLGLMAVILVVNAFGLMAGISRTTRSPTDSVRVTIQVVDAITNQAVPKVRAQWFATGGTATAALSAPMEDSVVAGVYLTFIHERSGIELELSADGYFSHTQLITVRNLDSSVDMRLTARMYPYGSTIATVSFVRGTDTLAPAWTPILERLGRELAQQKFTLQLRGWDVAPDTSNVKSLVVRRLKQLRQILAGYGVAEERMELTVKPLSSFTPLLLILNESPESQQIVIIPQRR